MMNLFKDEGNYEEIDLGAIEDEERKYLIVDQDTGVVYDLRNEMHVCNITDQTTKLDDSVNLSK